MSSTSLNESLACLALGYIAHDKDHSLEKFHSVITESSGDLWGKIVARCEIPQKGIATYRNQYSDIDGNMNPWIYTSYTTAITIEKSLKLDNLSDYTFSKVEKNSSFKSYWLKQKATSAIKKHSKEVLGNKAGILASLNADKVNIGDIFIIKNKSTKYNKLKELIENTDTTTTKLRNNISAKVDVLDMPTYRDLMIEAWKQKEIFSVSLKALDQKQDEVPVKVHNLPYNLSTTISEREQDRFAVYVSYLVRVASRNGNTFSEFKKAIDDFVEIKPVIFTAADRLNVHFDFVYDSGSNEEIRRKYHIFTNFGSGNAIHFVPEGSKSASGEGGITINYFHTLTKQFPEMKVFFKSLSKDRLEIFENACKAYNVSPHKILDQLGKNSMTSGLYHSSFYLAKDYANLIDKMLGESNIYMIGQVIKRGNDYYAKINDKVEKLDNSGNAILNDKGKPVMIHITEEKKILNPTNLLVIQKFFEDYTTHLSKTSGSMGKFLGISEKSRGDMRKKYQSIINKIEKLKVKEKKTTGSNTNDKQLTRQVLNDVKYSTPTYKKSYALLTNAEFGYLFAKYQQDIEEVLKKQVLLSFYSAASGRGYIIFDGKRFAASDYYEKNVSPPPFLKVGK
jgi:hypothetical protein